MGTMSKSATRWAPALYSWLCGGSGGGSGRRRVLLDARSRTRLFCIFIFNARPLIRARFIRFNGMLFGQLSDYSALRTLAVFLSVDVSQETLPLN